MQKREAKVGPRDRRGRRRLNERNDTCKNPHRNALSGAGPGIRGSGRLDGGVRSQMRTGLHPKFPANSENYREFFKFGNPRRLLVRENPRTAATSVSIRYANNRENNYRIRESFAQEQGCFRNSGGGREPTHRLQLPPKMGIMFPPCRSVSVQFISALPGMRSGRPIGSR